jgi:hypothetical protein
MANYIYFISSALSKLKCRIPSHNFVRAFGETASHMFIQAALLLRKLNKNFLEALINTKYVTVRLSSTQIQSKQSQKPKKKLSRFFFTHFVELFYHCCCIFFSKCMS